MKKIFLILFGLAILACSPKITTYDGGNVYGNSMVKDMDKKISMAQFDSMCVADKLPRNLGYWHFLELKTYEDNKRVSLFMLITDDGTVYRVEETMDDSVKIIKRKIIMLDE